MITKAAQLLGLCEQETEALYSGGFEDHNGQFFSIINSDDLEEVVAAMKAKDDATVPNPDPQDQDYKGWPEGAVRIVKNNMNQEFAKWGNSELGPWEKIGATVA